MPAEVSTLRVSWVTTEGSSCSRPSSSHVQRTLPPAHRPDESSAEGRVPASVYARKSSSSAFAPRSALEVIERPESENLRQFIEGRTRFGQQLRIGQIGRREAVAIVLFDPRIEASEQIVVDPYAPRHRGALFVVQPDTQTQPPRPAPHLHSFAHIEHKH